MLGHRNGLINLLLMCACPFSVKLMWANPTGPDPTFAEGSGSLLSIYWAWHQGFKEKKKHYKNEFNCFRMTLFIMLHGIISCLHI